MRCLILLVIPLIGLLVSCDDLGDPPSPMSGPTLQDTLYLEVSQGIILLLDGIGHEYDLEDTVSGVMRLINLASSVPLPLFTSNLPPNGYFLSRLGMPAAHYFYPDAISPAEWHDTLDLGDTLTFGVRWPSVVFTEISQSSALKSFSGMYQIQVGLGGSPALAGRRLTKFFRVTENGDPASVGLNRRGPSDSLLVDLVLRNRIGDQQLYHIDRPDPVQLVFLDHGDTAFNRSYPLPYSTLVLPPHSDSILFRLHVARSDTMFSGMHGGFHLWIVLKLREREFSPRDTFVFFP
ncbi:MAG: hypothetical protein ACKVRP_08235 [Bacteroidota bacterium]